MRAPTIVLLGVLVAGCASRPLAVPEAGRLASREIDAYRAALGARIADDAAEALERADELRSIEPWYVPAHVAWQDAAHALGRRDEARAWYESELASHPDDAARVLLAARLAPRAAGEREQRYRRAVALDPASPWASLALAFELNRRSLEAFEEAVRLSDEGYGDASRVQRELGARLNDESQALAADVVERHPELPEAFAGAGEVLLARGAALGNRATLLAALDRAERAAELDPSHPGRHALVARIRRELIDDAGAEEALRRALRLDPDDPVLLAGLGRVLLDLGRPEEARTVLRSARRQLTGDASVATDLGVAEHRVGDLDAAGRELAAAVELAPGDSRPLEALALVEIGRGDRAAARRALRRYVDCAGADTAWAETALRELDGER